MMPVKSNLARLTAASLLLVTGLCADTIIDDFTNAENDRFSNDPSFILDGRNLAGIGKNNKRWGTLVADNVILSAFHFHPPVGEPITFYATNDPAGPTESRVIVTGLQFGDSDVWLGILDSPLPPEYAPFPFATEDLTSAIQFNNSVYYGQTAYMLGLSPTSPDVALDMCVGRNKLSNYQFNQAWQSNVSVSGETGNAIRAFYNDPGDAAYVEHEAYLQELDSGGPLLVDIGGELRIVGFNWYIESVALPLPRDFSAVSYVGNFATQIQNIIDQYEGSNVPNAYFDWTANAFPGETDLATIGPNNDNDSDGLTNYEEFALVYDPLVYDNTPAGQASIIADQTELTVRLREEDDALNYLVETSSDLINWTSATLTFNASAWSTGNSNVATVSAQVDDGDSWTVTLRDAATVVNGAPRFMRIIYD